MVGGHRCGRVGLEQLFQLSGRLIVGVEPRRVIAGLEDYRHAVVDVFHQVVRPGRENQSPCVFPAGEETVLAYGAYALQKPNLLEPNQVEYRPVF